MPKKRNTVRADGRIAVQVYLGMVDGKRKYKTVYGKTQKEADEAAIQLKLRLRKGIDIAAERDSFSDWADRWLASKKNDVSNSQYKNYLSYVKHLNNSFEYSPINQIRTSDLQELIDSLALNNPHTKRPSSKKTLGDIKITARQIFEYAIENRVMDYNPASAVRIPQKAPVSARRALTMEEQGWVTDTPHRAQKAAMIMMYAGLRRGELTALSWDDIDLEAHTITVNKAAEIVDGKTVVKNMTKTSAGMRTIDIPQRLVDFLQAEKEKSIDIAFQIHPLVCTTASGSMMTPQAWKTLWASYMKTLNFKYGNKMDKTGKRATSKFNSNGITMTIPPITPHWLRHTFATLLYLSGVDILTAKNQLGHLDSKDIIRNFYRKCKSKMKKTKKKIEADVKTTLQIYTHLDSVYKRNSMSKLDDFLKNASQMQVR